MDTKKLNMQRSSEADVFDQIYGTIEDPNSWPAALDAIAKELRATGALIMVLLPDRVRLAIPSPRIVAAANEYLAEWAAKDIRSNRLDELKLGITHDTVVDADVVTKEEMDNHEFYTEFLSKHDLKYFCASLWAPTPSISAGLSIQRSEAEGEFSLADRQLALMLGRHVERAIRLRGKFVDERSSRESLEALTLHSAQAVLLVGAKGEVGFANDAARRLPRSVVSIQKGTVQFGSTVPRDQIMAAIRDATSSQPLTLQRPIFLPASEHSVGYAVSVMPRPRPQSGDLETTGVNRNLALVAFTPIKVDTNFDPAITRDFLGISLGEARIAALIAKGASPREISAELGLTEETVRVTLKRVFKKTGFKRQSELAAAIHALRVVPTR